MERMSSSLRTLYLNRTMFHVDCQSGMSQNCMAWSV